MTEILLILACTLSFTLNFTSTKIYQTKIQRSPRGIYIFQSLYCLIAAICFFVYGKFILPDLSDLIYGISFGILFASAVFFIAKALEIGSMSLSGIIVNMSLILPIIYSVIFMSEKMTLLQFIGLVLILVSLILSGITKEEKTNSGFKWLVLILIAFFSNGSTAIIQKSYCLKYNDKNTMTFMAVAYLTSAVIFFFINVISKDKTPLSKSSKSVGSLLSVSALAGIGSCLGNGILSVLSSKVDAAILYPCVNGGLGISVAIISFLVFKEKPNTKKIIAIILGTIAIVILNI